MQENKNKEKKIASYLNLNHNKFRDYKFLILFEGIFNGFFHFLIYF
jgi:hypothetical protein